VRVPWFQKPTTVPMHGFPATRQMDPIKLNFRMGSLYIHIYCCIVVSNQQTEMSFDSSGWSLISLTWSPVLPPFKWTTHQNVNISTSLSEVFFWDDKIFRLLFCVPSKIEPFNDRPLMYVNIHSSSRWWKIKLVVVFNTIPHSVLNFNLILKQPHRSELSKMSSYVPTYLHTCLCLN
jgi:hypothetical protein